MVRQESALSTVGAHELWIFVLALTSLLAGCDIQETPPQSQIDRLRVLSVRIDGPVDPASSSAERFAELEPGDTATLTPLVLAPGIAPLGDMTVAQDVCLEDYRALRWDRVGPACASGTARAEVHRFWFWCPPQAATFFDDPCTRTDLLVTPARIFDTEGIELLGPTCPPPAHGSVPSPTPIACIQPRSDLFTNPPADELTRRRGVLTSVLLVTVIDQDGDVAAGRLSELLAKIESGTVPSVVTLKRIPVVESPTNHNPAPISISSATGEITNGKTIGREDRLTVGYASADPQENYRQINTDGTEAQTTEKLDIAWLSGFGRFDDAHTLLTESNLYTPAKGTGIDLPPQQPAGTAYPMPFAVVVRDGRGGEAWQVRLLAVARP